MKVAIPADEKKTDSAVCISFGRTPYFVFYDTETKKAEYFDNGANSEQGGAGIKASQSIADAGCGAVITMRCGENAAKVLNVGKIKIYKSKYPTVKENLDAFEKGELAPLEEIHPGFHNHGQKA